MESGKDKNQALKDFIYWCNEVIFPSKYGKFHLYNTVEFDLSKEHATITFSTDKCDIVTFGHILSSFVNGMGLGTGKYQIPLGMLKYKPFIRSLSIPK